MDSKQLQEKILELVRQYAEQVHAPKEFEPGLTRIHPAGRVYGAEEMVNLVDSALEFWLTTGRYNEQFERKLAKFVGVRHALTVNSGSSANLLCVAALTSPKLGERALQAGDEVITVAAGFPTTVAPMLLYHLVPVFIDVDIPTYNAKPELIEAAVTPRTKAIMFAHTLGNPFDVREAKRVADKHGLWLVEDCCDALGSKVGDRMVGTFGNLASVSFYPAHHITMGEGGAVMTNDVALKPLVESFRDWGRDCWCAPGKENTCGKRFDWQLGSLPEGYDHKYTYSHVGFNLKITDMQAAVGLAQLNRLPSFIEARQRNFAGLTERLKTAEHALILPKPTGGTEPSWFGFPITVRKDSPVTRLDLTKHLESKNIGTRLLFAGNLVRQPMMQGRTYRIFGELTNSDVIMNNTFWIGLYPGIQEAQLDYVAEAIQSFVNASSAATWK